MNPYRQRVWTMLSPLIGEKNIDNALDFGCGDGWFATQVLELNKIKKLTTVDVKKRDNVLVEPIIYSGDILPFEDNQFDLTYTIDVLHHCDDPFAKLDDLMRVTKDTIIIKDHNYAGFFGRWTLAILDELGNRKFGIPSPYHYQQNWNWTKHLENKGWKQVYFLHPAICHTGLLSITNQLQYVSVYKRS